MDLKQHNVNASRQALLGRVDRQAAQIEMQETVYKALRKRYNEVVTAGFWKRLWFLVTGNI